MIYVDKNSNSNLITVPVIYSGQLRFEFTHEASGSVYDLTGPVNLSPSPLYWTIDVNGTSFEYLGQYALKIFKLTGESIWRGTMIVSQPKSIPTYDKNNSRDNVIFQ